jgi:carbonic anhydrase
VPWTYSGATGPETWGTIAPGCDPGPTGSQSPIDIESANLVGEENSPLAELFSKMPTTKTDESSAVALDRKIDPTDLIPVGSKVARYSGSLTTPPCTEPVIWTVYLTPSSVSAKQLDALGVIFPGNHRPTQPLNGRVINAVETS